MDHDRPSLQWVGVGRVPDEGNERQRVKRDPVVRPGGVVVLVHRPLGGKAAVVLARGRRGAAVAGFNLPKAEGPQRVRTQDVLANQGDDDLAVGVGAGVGPVEVALGLEWERGAKRFKKKETLTIFRDFCFSRSCRHLSVLEEVRDHDDDPGVLLPDHPPEAVEGALHGTLGGDVGAGRPEAVHIVGVQVVVLVGRGGGAGAALGPQADPGVVVCNIVNESEKCL